MPDSRGTFAAQGIEAEENAQVLFASFLPVAALPESKQFSDITLNASIDSMNDELNRTEVSAGMEQSGLDGDDRLSNIILPNLADMGMTSDVLPMNEANRKFERFDAGLQMPIRDELVIPETTPNLMPNVLEQINTTSHAVDNALKLESRVDPAVAAIIDKTILKNADLMTDEPAVSEKQITVSEDAKDKMVLQQVAVPAKDLVNKKAFFSEALSSQMSETSDESNNELTAANNISMRVKEQESVKSIANVASNHALPDSHSFDALLTNVADFLNKRLDTAVTPSQNKSGDAISLNTAAFLELDNNPALKAFQYSSNGLPASLKVDSYFATLKVYPPDLGQVTAEIQINKGMTELTLRADNPQVRHFIETSLPQLRESFENSHINLGEVTIQNNSPDNRQDFQKNHNSSFGNMTIQQKPDDTKGVTQARKQSSNSIIDTYA